MFQVKQIPAVLMGAGILAAALPQAAQAGEVDELKEMVRQLRAEVNELKAQQQAPAARPAAPAAVSGSGAGGAKTVADAGKPTSFAVGGASFTVYGNADIYANYMRSSSGKTLGVLEEGGIQRTRVGLKGEKSFDNGYAMKFNLEQGINLLNGSQADSTRLFDRQAWVGVATPIGEFRAGRQNTAVFYRGCYDDFGCRTMGGVINLFGVPSRYDSDLSYISPRLHGFQFEGHYSLAGAQSTTNDSANQSVYQAAIDWNQGPWRLGYAGIAANPPGNAKYQNKVRYDNYYANYDYGRGKVYLAFVRTNNNTASGALNNGGTLLGNVGGTWSGTNADVLNFYNIYQVSADYKLSPKLRLGALWGRIQDTADNGRNASGWNVGAYYDIFQDTVLYGLIDEIKNDPNAGFRPAGSAGLPTNFTAAADVNGQTIRGVQFGVMYKF